MILTTSSPWEYLLWIFVSIAVVVVVGEMYVAVATIVARIRASRRRKRIR